MERYLLTILIFLPTVGALLLLLMRSRDAVRWTTLGTTLATFVLSLTLLFAYDCNRSDNGDYDYTENGGNVQLVLDHALLHVLRGKQPVQGQTQQLVGRIAESARCRLIAPDDGAVAVEQQPRLIAGLLAVQAQ